MRIRIIEEAEDYIRAFYEKKKLNLETNKVNTEKGRSCSQLIRKSFTKKLINNIGKPSQNLFLMRFPILRKREARRIKIRSQQSLLSRVQNLESLLIFQG